MWHDHQQMSCFACIFYAENVELKIRKYLKKNVHKCISCSMMESAVQYVSPKAPEHVVVFCLYI